jgi:hypothetical protein
MTLVVSLIFQLIAAAWQKKVLLQELSLHLAMETVSASIGVVGFTLCCKYRV